MYESSGAGAELIRCTPSRWHSKETHLIYKAIKQLLVYHGYHYTDVIMGAIASQIISITIVCSTVYSDADQRKHHRSASLAFVWGEFTGPQMASNAEMFLFDDVIMFRLLYPMWWWFLDTYAGLIIIHVWLDISLVCTISFVKKVWHGVKLNCLIKKKCQHIDANTKLSPFRRHFQLHFREWKCMTIAIDCAGFFSWGTN